MSDNRNDLRNASGAFDPTAHDAMDRIDKAEKRVRRILSAVKVLLDAAGIDVLKFDVRDRRNGRVYK